MSTTRRPRKSSTGRPYGTAETKLIASLSEELDEDWKDFFNSYGRQERNTRRYLTRTLGVRFV